MPGLLDFLNTDEGRLGIGLLSAGMASPVPSGQRLAQVFQGLDEFKQGQMRNKVMQSQMSENEAQAAYRKTQAMAEQRKQQALPDMFGQGGMGAPQGGDAPTAGPQGSMQPGSLNWMRGLQAGYKPEELMKLAELQNIGRQEVARTIETTDAQGRPITVQLDKFGNRIGEGMGQWKAPMVVNQGDRQTFFDPATRQTVGSLGINMSQSERDASARGWAGQSLARERFAMEQQQGGKPAFNADAGGFILPPSQNNPQGGIIPLPGFQKPLNDVQAKAQLFGTRMLEADKILAGLSKSGKDFSTPGARTPIIGGLVNTLNSEQGQMLDQAKRDFTNAVLRRESGAAIASSEFDSADKQYFPQIGDSPKVIEQKARARELAIKGVLAEVPKGTPSIRAGGATGSFDAPAPRVPMKGQVLQGYRFKGGDPGNQANWEKQ